MVKALSLGAKTALSLGIVSAIDIFVFGKESLEAFNSGDFDTAAINAGLAIASAANFVIYLKSYRALKAAQAAVIFGDATVIGRGVAQIPHLATKALGLTIVIVTGVLVRLYTQDSALEKWLKNTRFGTRPASWADSYQLSMSELEKIISSSDTTN